MALQIGKLLLEEAERCCRTAFAGLLDHQRRDAEANEWRERAVIAACDSPATNVALDLVSRGESVAAERWFRRAIDLRPGSLVAACGLAMTLERLGSTEEAQRWRRRARPGDPRVLHPIVAHLDRYGRTEMAEYWRHRLNRPH